jgi:phosphate starvation-inducible PhoH-like protein|tara:strand:- start:149 stop:826 length:678 start_codon:yes stop_codon:yes gene_type:complete
LAAQANNNRKKRQEKKASKPKVLEAKTENQKNYIRSIIENDVVFCTGPSGSGKSFIAAGIAAHKLLRDEIDTVIVTRPLVCTGRDIGSLPGELNEKIKPYLQPMEENLRYFLGRDKFGYYFNQRRIKFEPLETMRGSTFHDSIMILDEAQNCTLEQIKMFVTRMGNHSKVLINGDNKQTDIYKYSGLDFCIEKLSGVHGVGICKLEYNDIQRNGIIGAVLYALES